MDLKHPDTESGAVKTIENFMAYLILGIMPDYTIRFIFPMFVYLVMVFAYTTIFKNCRRTIYRILEIELVILGIIRSWIRLRYFIAPQAKCMFTFNGLGMMPWTCYWRLIKLYGY